jgi:serine-type D-Ala-D-Ala endopeptidase (penicillin-binding protein 7)
VHKILLNLRSCTTLLLVLALTVAGQTTASAKTSQAAKGKPVAQRVVKSAKAVKSVKRVNVAKALPAKKSARMVNGKKFATAKRNGKLPITRQAALKNLPVSASRGNKYKNPVRRVSYMPRTETLAAGRSVRVQAEPPPSANGRTVIVSPQLANTARMSFGQLYGLQHTADPLELKSNVALVIDQDTDEVLVSKNSDAVLPIASLTKLMTAMVVVEARQSMDELVEVSQEDVDTEKNSSSRLAVGTTLTRGEALHLALMSSENRAAHLLGRYYPGGMKAFVPAMNQKSRQLGMFDSHFVDPTGLNSQNQSSAKDLVSLVKAASQKTIIRELSTSQGYVLQSGARLVQFHNTNSLVRDPTWDIGLQKTGYIVEAGRCLVMQARMAGRRLIMVFLDSAGKYSRLGDAERVRRWVENASIDAPPAAVTPISTISVRKSSS